MTISMIILALNAILIGALMSIDDFFTKWLAPVIGEVKHVEPVLPVPVIQLATLLLVTVGTLVAWRMYGASEVPTAAPAADALTGAARRDLYQDEVDETPFATPATVLAKTAGTGDRPIIDGILTSTAAASAGLGCLTSVTQNGYVRAYASYIFEGVTFILTTILGFRL